MPVTRTDLVSLFKSNKNLKGDHLPLVVDVLSYYDFLRKSASETHLKFIIKLPNFEKVEERLSSDVINIWTKPSLSIVSLRRVDTNIEQLSQKFALVEKRVSKSKKCFVFFFLMNHGCYSYLISVNAM